MGKLLQWRLAVGLSFYFAFVFCALPVMGESSFFNVISREGRSPFLIVAYTGVLVAAFIPFFSKYLKTMGSQKRAMLFACSLQSLGIGVLFCGEGLLSSSGQFVLCFLVGAGDSIAVMLWGVALLREDDEQRERLLVAVLLGAGFIVLLAVSLLQGVLRYALICFPLISFVCWHGRAVSQCGQFAAQANSDTGAHRAADWKTLREMLGKEYLKVTLVFSLVSFIWQQLASSMSNTLAEQEYLFGLGFMLAAAVLWLFTQFSSGIQLELAIRWVFPLMALGLLCTSFPRSLALSVACLILASTHAALEMTMRLQIIGMAKMSQRDEVRAIGLGFFAISLGAVLGEMLFLLFARLEVAAGTYFAVAFAYTILVVVASLFQKKDAGLAVASPSPTADVAERGERMRRRYGLSNREHEVLLFLLEGRSHPYIRDTLFISKSTVDTHVRHIYRKVGVKSKQELIDLSKSE